MTSKKFLYMLVPSGEIIQLGVDSGGMGINHEGKPQQIFIDFENRKVKFNIPKKEETEFNNYDSFGVYYSDTEEDINNLLKSREENKPPSPEGKKSKVLKQTNTEKPSIISNFSTFPSKN